MGIHDYRGHRCIIWDTQQEVHRFHEIFAKINDYCSCLWKPEIYFLRKSQARKVWNICWFFVVRIAMKFMLFFLRFKKKTVEIWTLWMINLENRNSCQEEICKKGILENFAKFTGKHLCRGLFFNKVAGLRRLQLY